MADDKKIFRAEALEQLDSPEQLEELLQVTDRRAWLSIATLAGLLFAGVAWSVFGQIPITVDGIGVVTFPRSVVSFQAPSQGQIAVLNVSAGTTVAKGDVIGVITLPGLLEELEAEQVKLAGLQQRNTQVTDLSKRRNKLEEDAIVQQTNLLQVQIQSTEENAILQRERSLGFISDQLRNIDSALRTQKALQANLRERFRTFVQLKSEGLSSDDVVLNAKQNVISNEVKISELELKKREIELSRARAEDTYQEQMQKISDLKGQQQQLLIKQNQLTQQGLESASDRGLQLQSINDNIAKLTNQLETRGKIVSEFSGRILELAVGSGQIVSGGQRLGSIEVDTETGEMLGFAYFSVGDGKKVKQNMEVQISPGTVQRERHGSIEGVVTNVSPFPVSSAAVTNLIGNAEAAKELLQGSTKIQVTCQLLVDPDSPTGFKWTSGEGPPDTITAGTTAAIRVTIEYRRPITYAIPILRSWTGI